MEKEFNVTGTCRPAKHYMADVSKKWNNALRLIEKGKYFIINRPRQYGKTTALYAMADILRGRGDYLVFNMSFEGISDMTFDGETTFSPNFVTYLARSIRPFDPAMTAELRAIAPSINSFDALSEFITAFYRKNR